MPAITEVAEVNPLIQSLVPPTVHLDSHIGEPDPENPKVLFSLRIPAKHQAKSLSIVRMQDCDLMHVLQDAKMDNRDLTKFMVPIKSGLYEVKLHFLLFPNKNSEIQVDYTYTPQTPAPESHDFALSRRVDEEVKESIHGNPAIQHGINNFAAIVHDLVCEFIDRVYYDSLVTGKEPDYLIMTPPPAVRN